MHACGAKRAGDRYGFANTALILCRALIANSNASFPGSGQTRFAEKAYGEKITIPDDFSHARRKQRQSSYGRIANTRAGNPEPPFGFGNVQTMSAPDSGT